MEPATLGSRILLTLLLVVSISTFYWRLRKTLAAIAGSKKDPRFTLRPAGPRLRRFFWQVLCQAKVIRYRPLPGLAHAFVFWGFLAFALVTIDHISGGFGFHLVDRGGRFGGFYFFLAAIFALLVGFSIIGLAVRRFLVRPRWLGEVSWESGLIALLIYVLMFTYLAEYILRLNGITPRPVLWWLHTLALLVFLPLIPRTKHLHLLLSPVTVLLSPIEFSKIPPLEGDEDFGLDSGKDVTQLTALQAYSCVECGRCTQHCPAYNTGKVLNPTQIVLGLRDYLNEFGAAAALPLLGHHLSQEAAFQCTTCGACEHQCPVGIQHLPVIIGLRRGAANTGKWDDDYGNKLFLNLERYGNPLGLASSERDRFIEKNNLPLYDGKMEIALWLGCMGGYDPQGRQTILSLVRLLDHLEISYGVLKKERCTGDAARRLGNDLSFGQLAEANLEALRAAKVRRLLSICPHCVRTIAEDWKEYGEAPPIEHHSEFLARHAGRLPFQQDGVVVFHDPCYLGRYRGVYEPPRTVLKRFNNVIDPPRSRATSFCCGAGGGLTFLGEEKGNRVSHARAAELAGTGAPVIAAACPFCNSMLRDALAAVVPNPPALVDIAEIAAAALPGARRQAAEPKG